MNKIQKKVKDWIISHFRYPERMEDIDHVWLDFIVVTLPAWIMQIAGYSLMVFIYVWLYNKYGFEKVVILLFVNVIFAIGMLRKTLTM